MITVNSYKPLEQAIKDGEKTVKVEAPKFLVACAVAEKCEGMTGRIKSFLDLLLNRSLCADALKVMDILRQYGAGLQVCRNEEGALTGEMQIIQ